MKHVAAVVVLVIAVAVVLVLIGTFYIVDETQQVVITRFGKPVGDPVVTPGLKMKVPFVQKANYFEKRFLEWDGDPNQLPTKDKRFIYVDTYARWRISDPLLFFKRLRDERGALSRLADILDGDTRNIVARHKLIEIVRSTNREFSVAEDFAELDAEFQQIGFGRNELAAEVLSAASERTSDLGIEILDFRFKRINYIEKVRNEVEERMISERQRISQKFRSEGDGEAARINGERERALRVIRSEAYKEAEEVKGDADAEAANVYAKAYNANPEFYRFLKSMEVLGESLDKDTTLLLGTDGEFLRYLESAK